MTLRFNALLLSFLVIPGFAFAAAEKPEYCRYVEKYKQPDGVEYQPGVDVHGKPVVPADLNSNLNGIYEGIVIPIEIDLINRYNLSAPAGAELKPVVADMTIHKDGRVDYNGHDLTEQAVALCTEWTEKPDNYPVIAPPADNGQGSADDLSSAPSKGKLIEGSSP